MFSEAVLVVIAEANMSYVAADRIRGLLSHPGMRPLFMVSRDPTKKNRPGVWTGEVEKVLYSNTLERVLANRGLTRAHTLVSPATADPNRADAHWEFLLKQMNTFRRIVHQPLDEALSKFRVAYTGKGGGAKDDLVLALQMALYWGDDVRRDATFVAAAEEAHWNLA